jgi:hypothetical protein
MHKGLSGSEIVLAVEGVYYTLPFKQIKKRARPK